VNRKRVARIMREAGIQGLYRRRRGGCTVSDPGRRPTVAVPQRRRHLGEFDQRRVRNSNWSSIVAP
jgi:putative transposase